MFMSLKTQMINVDLFLKKLFSRGGGYDQNTFYTCIKFQNKHTFKKLFSK